MHVIVLNITYWSLHTGIQSSVENLPSETIVGSFWKDQQHLQLKSKKLMYEREKNKLILYAKKLILYLVHSQPRPHVLKGRTDTTLRIRRMGYKILKINQIDQQKQQIQKKKNVKFRHNNKYLEEQTNILHIPQIPS